MQDIFLLQRESVARKVNEVFDGTTKELCLRTGYPKQVTGFISACLAQRGELETRTGNRWFFGSAVSLGAGGGTAEWNVAGVSSGPSKVEIRLHN
jgi:hypothetical protein